MLLKMIVLLLPLIFVTNCLGFFQSSEYLIALPGLGSLWLGDLFLLFAISIALLKGSEHKKTDISTVIWIFLTYFVLLAIYNTLTGYPIQDTLNGFKGVAYYFYLIPIINLIDNQKEFNIYLFLIVLYSMLSGAMIILGYSGIVELDGLWVNTLTDIRGYESVIRYYPLAEFLIDLIIYILLVLIITKVNLGLRKTYITFLTILIISVMATFTRSTMILIILSYLIIVFSTKPVSKALLITITSTIFVIFIFSNIIVDTDLYAFVIRLLIGGEETITGTGNIAGRMEILLFKFNSVFQDSPIFGRGFNWGPNAKAGNFDLNPFARSYHNGYASIFVIGGFLGVILTGYLFLKIYKYGKRLYFQQQNSFFKAIILGVIIFTILINVKAMVTDPYFDPIGSIVIAISWGLLIKIDQLSSENHQPQSTQIKNNLFY